MITVNCLRRGKYVKRHLESALVAAAATVLLAGCGGSGESGRPSMSGPRQKDVPSGPYQLKMPKSVEKGTFTESDHSEPDQNIASMLSGQIEHGVSAFAAYQPADRKSETSGPVVSVTGVYGTVLSPVTARDEFLKILDSRTIDTDVRSTVIVGPRTITPQGSSEPVSCRIVRKADEFGTTWKPDCSWADGSAVVDVSQTVDPDQPPAAFDLEAFAARTATIRDEVRAPQAS
ncbi:hypothetical protein ACH5A3_24090 [Streptomyces echinatus]|uniref:hypothetical protein n=1 Tax=Streptomyces echinatus TaxID=67293 RepID=UPI0037AF1AA0